MPRKTKIFLLASCLFGLFALSCSYVPPPEVKMVQPETGTFFEGDPIKISFSEAVDRNSVSLRIWSGERDIENELTATEPLLETCTLGNSPCGKTVLDFSENNKELTLNLDPEGLGKADVPLSLEILSGIEGSEGGITGTSLWFDFQFKPGASASDEPMVFDNGTYIAVATTKEPMEAIINLITHMIVLEDGRLALAGAEGKEIDGAAANTANPDELVVQTDNKGYAVFAYGTVKYFEQPDGSLGRFLESDPFEVSIKLGPILVGLHEMRLSGDVEKDPETNKDRISGTLSYSSVTLTVGETATEYGAGNPTFVATYVPEEKVPAGAPALCGDLCGVVPQQCEPPDDFPGTEFCAGVD